MWREVMLQSHYEAHRSALDLFIGVFKAVTVCTVQQGAALRKVAVPAAY